MKVSRGTWGEGKGQRCVGRYFKSGRNVIAAEQQRNPSEEETEKH